MKEKFLKIEVDWFDEFGNPDLIQCEHLAQYLRDHWEILSIVKNVAEKNKLIYNVNLIKN